MSKTGSEVEREVFALINASEIKTTIKGSVLRPGIRDPKAVTEDAVVSFMTGIDDQIQSGVLNINIYTPFIASNSGKVRNNGRCLVLEVVAKNVVASLKNTDYRFSLAAMIQTFDVEDMSQSFVNIKLKFQIPNF